MRNTKWTTAKLNDVINRRMNGERVRDLAAEYGISPSTITSIILYHRPDMSEAFKGARLRRMSELWKSGADVRAIAEEMHVTPNTVYRAASKNRDLFPRRHKA